MYHNVVLGMITALRSLLTASILWIQASVTSSAVDPPDLIFSARSVALRIGSGSKSTVDYPKIVDEHTATMLGVRLTR